MKIVNLICVTMTKLRIGVSKVEPTKGLHVVVAEQGPYLLYGVAPFVQQFIMSDDLDESWFYKSGKEYSLSQDPAIPTALCRCGASGQKPYCDGTHANVEWDGELTSPIDRLLDDAQYFEGEELLMSDSERYCCYARFCHPGGGAWRLTRNSGDEESRKLAIREASMCPSARLMAWGRGEDAPYEFDFEPSIGLLEDPAIECSAGIWLRGGVPVEKMTGERYEIRNRVVLCRCGASGNKPYCDGSHASVHWRDGELENPRGEELPDGELEIEASESDKYVENSFKS